MDRRRTPQEKKQLSYSKDRRNWYGENDKSSRKNIALRKRLMNRATRHRANQRLAGAVGLVDATAEAQVAERVTGTRRRADTWRKAPDTQLGAYVIGKLRKRVREGNASAPSAECRIEKIRRSTVPDVDRHKRW
ncbi:hypothetical protein [Kibdelosporangium phytohabitans]|uniref:Uncharacterized protein n=1 Tax=Kibdelosporangium phytohabitans TaxID=860235 RepID=A0A0N9HUU4_9PSEU|nr:hypothetical protein [Kibdelosporangium phytohabitans]ALG06674.1 hypothetical protein AOZ06_06810 [Kibdelosporangium phytohabitans]MBE1467890.1 hypothetical protein [Kibdelosporangium phytohabitans]